MRAAIIESSATEGIRVVDPDELTLDGRHNAIESCRQLIEELESLDENQNDDDELDPETGLDARGFDGDGNRREYFD
jgi:hypothetical protein